MRPKPEMHYNIIWPKYYKMVYVVEDICLYIIKLNVYYRKRERERELMCTCARCPNNNLQGPASLYFLGPWLGKAPTCRSQGSSLYMESRNSCTRFLNTLPLRLAMLGTRSIFEIFCEKCHGGVEGFQALEYSTNMC